jgi:ABC-type lipoprotein export system ATPase subunit
LTLVLVTHNPELKKLADRTLNLFAGKLKMWFMSQILTNKLHFSNISKGERGW